MYSLLAGAWPPLLTEKLDKFEKLAIGLPASVPKSGLDGVVEGGGSGNSNCQWRLVYEPFVLFFFKPYEWPPLLRGYLDKFEKVAMPYNWQKSELGWSGVALIVSVSDDKSTKTLHFLLKE